MLSLRWHSANTRAGRLDEAAAAYRQMIALRPDIAEAYNNLGNILAQQGKLDLAAARFGQAIALGPILPRPTTTWATCSGARASSTRPRHASSKRSLFGPTIAEAHNNLGNVLLQQGKLDQAAARFEQAIALRPDYAEAHNNLGNVLWKQGKLDEAAARYEQALALRPDYAEAHNNLGNVLLEPGQARRSGGTFRASAGSPARLRRRAIGPGRLLFGRRGLRARLACV